jgi:hypothetical protein
MSVSIVRSFHYFSKIYLNKHRGIEWALLLKKINLDTISYTLIDVFRMLQYALAASQEIPHIL